MQQINKIKFNIIKLGSTGSIPKSVNKCPKIMLHYLISVIHYRGQKEMFFTDFGSEAI